MSDKRCKYQGVSLPVPLIDEIKKHNTENLQYKGVAEFVKSAIREKIRLDKVMSILSIDVNKKEFTTKHKDEIVKIIILIGINKIMELTSNEKLEKVEK